MSSFRKLLGRIVDWFNDQKRLDEITDRQRELQDHNAELTARLERLLEQVTKNAERAAELAKDATANREKFEPLLVDIPAFEAGPTTGVEGPPRSRSTPH